MALIPPSRDEDGLRFFFWLASLPSGGEFFVSARQQWEECADVMMRRCASMGDVLVKEVIKNTLVTREVSRKPVECAGLAA